MPETCHLRMSQDLFVLFSRPKLTKIWNEPKPTKTSQNNPKPEKATPKNCETTRNEPNFQNWRNLEFSISFRFSNFEPKSPNLGFWAKKYQLSNIPRCLHPISKVVISNLTLLFEVARPNAQIWAFWVKAYQIPNFNEISKVLISNLKLVFKYFEPKSPNLGFWVKMYQLSKLNEILPVPYYKGVDFRFWSDIGFRKFWAQMLKFRHFGPKI